MKNLYDYIKAKLKDKGLRIEDLYQACNVSRTTMYRLMKGLSQPDHGILEKMIAFLGLTPLEQQEVYYYLRLSAGIENYDRTMESVAHMLTASERAASGDDHLIEFFRGSDRLIRDFDEIFQEVLQAAEQEGFYCEIKIVNFLDSSFAMQLRKILEALIGKAVSVEHLVNFWDDESQNIEALCAVLPLLAYRFYTVYYSGYINLEAADYFSNLMLVKFSDSKSDSYMVLSPSQTGNSICYSFQDKHLYRLFFKQYEGLKKHFQSALIQARSADFLNEFSLNIELHSDIVLIKPNPCYNRIPYDCYISALKRINGEHISALDACVPGFHQIGVERFTASILEIMQKRIEASRINHQVDICTREGLEQLAATGRLSDDYPFFPGLNRQEVKTMLLKLKAAVESPTENYQLRITNLNLDPGCYFLVSKGGVVEIGSLSKELYGDISNNYIEHPLLSKIFIEFATSYLPSHHCLSDDETAEFLSDLIKRYCD